MSLNGDACVTQWWHSAQWLILFSFFATAHHHHQQQQQHYPYNSDFLLFYQLLVSFLVRFLISAAISVPFPEERNRKGLVSHQSFIYFSIIKFQFGFWMLPSAWVVTMFSLTVSVVRPHSPCWPIYPDPIWRLQVEGNWMKENREAGRANYFDQRTRARPAPGSGQWRLMAALLHAPKSLSPQPNNPPTTPLSGSPSQHKTQRREPPIEQFCEKGTSSIHPKFGWVAQHCIVVKDQTI